MVSGIRLTSTVSRASCLARGHTTILAMRKGQPVLVDVQHPEKYVGHDQDDQRGDEDCGEPPDQSIPRSFLLASIQESRTGIRRRAANAQIKPRGCAECASRKFRGASYPADGHLDSVRGLGGGSPETDALATEEVAERRRLHLKASLVSRRIRAARTPSKP